MAQIHIVVGSRSDLKLVKESGLAKILEEVLGVPGARTECKVSICSAHRNGPELQAYVEQACQEGAKVFIGIAGMAAALPGAMAASSRMAKPVIAVPLDIDGVDSCLYMPPGVPVLLAGVGKVGLKQAAVAACQILAASDRQLELALHAYIAKTTKQPEFDIDFEEIA